MIAMVERFGTIAVTALGAIGTAAGKSALIGAGQNTPGQR